MPGDWPGGGGTAFYGRYGQLLRDNDLPVIEVGDYTGFPEMMDGRVKTLHPKVHGGILGRRGTDDEVMNKHGIGRIDLVAVNLYPFQETVANPDCDLPTAIENIDIGGPTMIRAAAKNHKDVAVVVDPADYDLILSQMRENNNALRDDFRFHLAVKTFEHTAQYDGAIANYLGAINLRGEKTGFSNTINLQFRQAQHALWRESTPKRGIFCTGQYYRGLYRNRQATPGQGAFVQ